MRGALIFHLTYVMSTYYRVKRRCGRRYFTLFYASYISCCNSEKMVNIGVHLRKTKLSQNKYCVITFLDH